MSDRNMSPEELQRFSRLVDLVANATSVPPSTLQDLMAMRATIESTVNEFVGLKDDTWVDALQTLVNNLEFVVAVALDEQRPLSESDRSNVTDIVNEIKSLLESA